MSSRLDFAGRIDRVHYAWLCDQCSHKFEVVLDTDNQVGVRPRRRSSGLMLTIIGMFAFKMAPSLALASDFGALFA